MAGEVEVDVRFVAGSLQRTLMMNSDDVVLFSTFNLDGERLDQAVLDANKQVEEGKAVIFISKSKNIDELNVTQLIEVNDVN